MGFTEKRSGPGPTAGSFDINLERPPRRLLDDLEDYPLSYVVVYPVHQPLDAIDPASSAAQAIYFGQIQKLDRNQSTLTGAGLAVLLGDQGGVGDIIKIADFTTGSLDVEDHVDTYVVGSTNGLTKGTVGSDATTFPLEYRSGDTRRDILTAICDACDADYEWRIDITDATFDVDTAANLFTQDAVILTRDAGGRDGSITGLRAALELEETDWSDLTSEYIVDWNSGVNNGSSTNSITNMKNPAGGTLTREAYTTNQARAPKPSNTAPGWAHAAWAIAGQTEANQLAATLAGRTDDARLQIGVEIDEYAPTRFIKPGDTIYVYDPLLGIVNTSNQVQYRGEVTFPEQVRVLGMDWPLQEGMGVYHYRWNGSGMELAEDLTPWVAFETGTTSIEVGALRRTLTA